MIKVQPTCKEHIEVVLANLREHDKPTFAAIPDPALALYNAINKSSYSCVALLDGEVLALWGADIKSILNDSVFIWMVTTPLAEAHPVAFARKATGLARAILAEYGQIEGTVVTRNKIAIKWVTWLGAELLPTGMPGVLEFRLRRDSHPRWRTPARMRDESDGH